MTREERAFEASKRFEESLTEKDISTLSKDDMCFAFQLGVKWADSHPESPLISVNEKLPPIEKNNLSKNSFSSLFIILSPILLVNLAMASNA